MVMIVWHVDLQRPVKLVPITTKVVSSNSCSWRSVIKFVSDLRQVDGFHRVLWYLPGDPPTKLTATIKVKYCDNPNLTPTLSTSDNSLSFSGN